MTLEETVEAIIKLNPFFSGYGKEKLTQLITTLQKETWDQACKAQREPSKYKIGIDWEKRIAGVEFIEPPFNPNL